MNKATIPYTYLIRHKESGNLYHGSRTRKGCNPDELLKEKGYKTSSKIIKNIIEEQGLEAFEIINIEVFDNIENARLAEESYHNQYDVRGNIYYFNQWNAGTKFCCDGHTEEARRKISEAGKGRKISENHRKILLEANLGRKHSEETKAKISEYIRTDDHKRKISEASKNKTDEQRRKISEANLGRKHSEETKRKISEYAKNMTDKHRRKISEANLGRKHSEETKAKMSASHKGKIMADEHRKNLSEAVKENWKKLSEVECPHCHLEGKGPNMKRYHFDNCKHKNKENV